MRPYLAEGIDISKHNGNVNMKAVRDNAKINHVIIRAGYGQNNIDQQFVKNAEAAVNLGMNAGIYWFSYALNARMAEEEAVFAINAAKKYWSKCAIAYDAEYDTRTRAAKAGINLGKKELTAMAYAFLARVMNEGYYPILYTNNDYTKNYFDIPWLKDEIPSLYIWYARYGKEDDNIYTIPVDMWQYSSSGAVSGINGRVDMNKLYSEYNFDNLFETSTPADNVNSSNNGLNLYIKWFQQAASVDGYRDQDGETLDDDGVDGPKTQYVRKQVLLKRNNWKKGVIKDKNLTIYLQGVLKDRGIYHGELDGMFGDMTFAALRQYQIDNNLEVDGIAGYETLTCTFYN